MSIIVVASAIGGAGKTTAALCISAALAKIQGDAVPTVLIDLDPDGDATRRMGLAREGLLLGPLIDGRRKAGDAIGSFSVADAALMTPEGFSIVPSSDDIALVEMHFAGVAGGTALFAYRLHALGRGCRLVIDTAPGIGTFFGRAAIMAAEAVIIPVIPGPGAGRRVLDVVGMLRGRGGNAQIFVVAAQADGTGSDVAALNDELRGSGIAVNEWFPHDADVARAGVGTPIVLAPTSRCALSYRSLARKVDGAVGQRQHVKPGSGAYSS